MLGRSAIRYELIWPSRSDLQPHFDAAKFRRVETDIEMIFARERLAAISTGTPESGTDC